MDPGGRGHRSAGAVTTPGEPAQTALERLAAAAAERARLAACPVHPGIASTEDVRAHRRAVSAAVAALHAAVIDAHRHGVLASEIATTAGLTQRYTTRVLTRDRPADPYRWSPRLAGARRRRVLNAVIAAAAVYGTAHPVTHQAIVDAHADGATPMALGRILDVSPAMISRVVLAGRPAGTTPL